MNVTYDMFPENVASVRTLTIAAGQAPRSRFLTGKPPLNSC